VVSASHAGGQGFAAAEELAILPVQRGQDVTVAMWLPLTTGAYVECTQPDCMARQMYLGQIQ
jgi:hypothetical protein